MSSLLCICSTDAGVMVELDAYICCTLGTIALCRECLHMIGVSTFGEDVIFVGGYIGIVYMGFN